MVIWLQDFDNIRSTCVPVELDASGIAWVDNNATHHVDKFHPLHKDVCRIYYGTADKDTVFYVAENI